MNQQEARLLLQVRDYNNANLHRPIPVAVLCRKFHISKTKLQAHFRESIGCSLHAFMVQQRMWQATRWLRETNEPVKRIAWECGYRNVRSFNKTFKNHWQLSPDRYRKKYQTATAEPAVPTIPSKSNTLPSESDTHRLGKGCGGIVT
jgi:AraC-like DNA-binding protein